VHSPRRARRLRHRCALKVLPLSLALIGPLAHAAAFLPGPEADPPTGDVPPAAGAADARLEPLQADGFEWRLGPWRRVGSVTLDARWLRAGDASTLVQGITHTQFDWANYLWQPWFAQTRLGIGVLTASDRQSGALFDEGARHSVALTGRGSLSLFPSSRFPFELRAEFGDTRAGGPTLGGDVETRRITLSQSYTPVAGNDRLQLQIDHSRLQSDVSADTLTTFLASAQRTRGPHSFELSANASINRTDLNDESTRLVSLVARHGFQPSGSLQVDTLATLTDFRTDDVGLFDEVLGTQVRQVSSLATWRPQPGEALYWDTRPLQLAGSVRWIDARAVGDRGGAGAQSLSATAGATLEWTRDWRIGASLGASHASSDADNADGDTTTRAVSGNGNLTWAPAGVRFGEWSYGPSASLTLGVAHSDSDGRRWLAGVQGGHTLARQWRLSDTQALSLEESRAAELARSLAHSVALYWQALGDGDSQRYASLTLSDTRTRAADDGSYQFASLGLNQRSAITRYTSWSANIALQATRNESTEIDTFSGALLTRASGWQTYYSGGASLEQQRLFGVPRLRHTLQLTFNSQQLERREFGDIDASRQRVSAALESRIDYAVGKLSLRFVGRLARIENQTQALLMARAQRTF
jgi:Autotransporter beta-domain